MVRLDRDGAARIPFDIPDSQGPLRLMAVAFSAHKVGSATASMTVRDPVVTTVSLPRFLAPGDAARIGVTINNVEGAAGDYHLTLAASGSAQFKAPASRTVKLAPGGEFNDGLALSATSPGDSAAKLRRSLPRQLRS